MMRPAIESSDPRVTMNPKMPRPKNSTVVASRYPQNQRGLGLHRLKRNRALPPEHALDPRTEFFMRKTRSGDRASGAGRAITHYQGKKMMTATKPAITSTQAPHSTADLLPVGGKKPSQVL
jgi:hypothetical protein